MKDLTMSFMKNMLLVALFAFIAIGCGQQQGASQDFTSEIAISDAGFTSLQQLDWAGYASQVEADGVARFGAMLKPGIEKLILASTSDSVNLFGKNFNSLELQSLDPNGFFVLIMNMVSDVSPEIKTTFSNMTNEAMGAIPESDSIVHIVIKTKMMIGTRSVDEMNIQSVIKIDGGWKLVMSPKMDGIALMLANAFPR